MRFDWINIEIFLIFQNQKDHLIEHLINTKTSWKCEKCKPTKIFFDIWSIKEHLFIYHTQAIFRCLFCLKLFTERSLLTVRKKENIFLNRQTSL
ncbi:unnamed protein product [Meloidogyne enterolobii]|uniref:Uncharacterized protein n=1 Tax=Meloidogyne enterolobii TaxID=390850 RepID=A0ACB0ZR32_MELEN